MALFEVDCFSEALGHDVSINVVMPDAGLLSDNSCKALLLLHGKGDNYTKWLRRTSVERYAKRHNLAVIMPDGKKSFYADMVRGGNYWTFVSQEVMSIARNMFPALSDRREDNFVAGLSMGGYGAFKVALNHPESFCKVASFSGAVDTYVRAKAQEDLAKAVFGGAERIPGTNCDLWHVCRQLKEGGGTFPEIYFCCGESDRLLGDNQRFEAYLKQLGIPHTFETWAGNHDWDFWDTAVENAIEFFFKNE